MESLEGHTHYWPISARYNQFEFTGLVDATGIHVSLRNFKIPQTITDLVYVKNLNLLFFLMKQSGIQDTIYAQAFHRNDSKGEISKNFMEMLFTEAYPRINLYGFEILKLVSTENNLFALVKEESQYCIINLGLSVEEIFTEKNIKTKINLDIGINNENCDLLGLCIAEYSRYESIVFIKSPKDSKYYFGNYFTDPKKQIHFSLLESEIGIPTQITKVCIRKAGNLIKFFAYCQDSATVYDVLFNVKLRKFTIESDRKVDLNSIDLMQYFTLSVQSLLNDNIENQNIELLILVSEDKLLMLDLENDLIKNLIGVGEIDPATIANDRKNLCDYKINRINYLYTIYNNCIFYGNIESSSMFAIVLPTLKVKMKEVRTSHARRNKNVSNVSKYES